VGYVFGQTINNTGFGGQSWTKGIFIFVFLTGLLMAQYTITGYDASAHMSEETRSASIGAAWGMVMSVVVSVIFGFILLVAVTFAVPDDKGALAAGTYIVTYIWQTSMSTHWAEILLFVAVVAQVFCTIAWICFICVVFMLPVFFNGSAWQTPFLWSAFNYTPIMVGAAFFLFGGWWVLSAKRWFKGPIRQGDEAELERIEREFGEGEAP